MEGSGYVSENSFFCRVEEMSNAQDSSARLLRRLRKIYPEATAEYLAGALMELVARYRQEAASALPVWSERDALLIAYGDSIRAAGRKPLAALAEFLERYGSGFRQLHLLPFYPYSSDDGFAVIDYRQVRPDLGDWNDIARLGRSLELVFDGVVNHVSSESHYLREYLAGNPDYADFFLDLDPATDTSSVLRTRNLPLLHEYEAADGSKKHLWTTFSRDQVDFNFRNPAVLLEIADILLFYAERGAKLIRLDAIPYLWKELGTSCAHLPQTHELIKLFRDLYDLAAPEVRLLTETNVPYQENIAYFGDHGDEAQLIYNFTLSPLIVWSMLKNDATVLTEWARQVRPVSPRATYLNITATHDGIGVRPTEGILSDSDRRELVEMALARGGNWSGKTNADGSISPYELNLSYFDAINDPRADLPLALQIQRFLLSQAITVAFLGLPGIYIHSLVGSRNDCEGVRRTGRARSINREILDLAPLAAELDDPETRRGQVWRGMKKLLALRASRPELSPQSEQRVLSLAPEVFALERRAADGATLLALFHFGASPRTLRIGGAPRLDLWSGETTSGPNVTLEPFQFRFLVEA